MKTCSKCREGKALGEFRKDARRKDGHDPQCKECRHLGYEKNREKVLAKNRDYRERNREQILEYARSYYANNREEGMEKRRSYYERNRGKFAEQRRVYRERNREHLLVAKRSYGKSVAAQVSSRMKQENDQSRSKATHHGQPWTRAEDEIILRTDLTEKEKAFMLRRSIHSVSSRRRNLRRTGVLA